MEGEFRPEWVSPPGTTLREIMELKGLTSESLVEATGIPLRELEEILRGIIPITEVHAAAFEKVSGAPASFWLRREQHYTEDLKRLGLRRGAVGGPGDDRQRGLYNKYVITRTDGSTGFGKKHEKCEFFVLDLDHDPFAIPALEAYITACKGEYPELARDLMLKVAELKLEKYT